MFCLIPTEIMLQESPFRPGEEQINETSITASITHNIKALLSEHSLRDTYSLKMNVFFIHMLLDSCSLPSLLHMLLLFQALPTNAHRCGLHLGKRHRHGPAEGSSCCETAVGGRTEGPEVPHP